MPRIAALIALMLMLLTGLVVGSLNTLAPAGQTVKAIPVESVESDATSRSAVAFYEAIDLFLESGDVSGLRRIVHPAYVDHSHLSDTPGTLPSLETWLHSIRESSPDVRFAISEVTSRNDLIAVELEQAGVPETTIAGLPVNFPAASTGYELLRIENELVAERWASPALPGLIESAASLDGLMNAGWIREPRIERLTFASRASLEVAKHKGTVLILESGALNLSIPESPAPVDSRSPAGSIPDVLKPGSIHPIAPDTPFRIWNTGPEPASLIALTVVQLSPVDYHPANQSENPDESGVSRLLLAGGATIRPEIGPFQLLVGHAVAAPGSTIARHKANEMELLFVTQGRVEALVHDGFVFSLTDVGGLETENDVATLGPDQAISAGFGTELAYEVTSQGPAEFWVVTIMPEG